VSVIALGNVYEDQLLPIAAAVPLNITVPLALVSVTVVDVEELSLTPTAVMFIVALGVNISVPEPVVCQISNHPNPI
jgi:hypothetical protein